MKDRNNCSEDMAAPEKQKDEKLVLKTNIKPENDCAVDALTNNLSALKIKREPVEDNELPDSPTSPENSGKKDRSSAELEDRKPNLVPELPDDHTQRNSEFKTRGPSNGVPTTNSIHQKGYNKHYGMPNMYAFKENKRCLDEDDNEPPLRYRRPDEDQLQGNQVYNTQASDNIGRMVVKSPSVDFPGLNFSGIQDEILDLASNNQIPDLQYNTPSYSTVKGYPMAVGPQNTYGTASHGYPQQGMHPMQNVTQANATVNNSNANMLMNNNLPNMDQQAMYGHRDKYVSESSDSECARSPYSDQMYSPDNSVKSINSPPPSNLSSDSGIIGDLTVNSPAGSATPPYDTAAAMHNGYNQWEDTTQNSPMPSPVASQQQTSTSVPQYMVSSPVMPQQRVTSPPQMAGSPLMQQPVASPPQMAGSPLMQQPVASPPQYVPSQPHMVGSPPMMPMSVASPAQTGSAVNCSQAMPSVMQMRPPMMGNTMMPQVSGSAVAPFTQTVSSVPNNDVFLATEPQTGFPNSSGGNAQQIDEEKLKMVMEVLTADLIDSNNKNKPDKEAVTQTATVPPVMLSSQPSTCQQVPVGYQNQMKVGPSPPQKVQSVNPQTANLINTMPNNGNMIPVTMVSSSQPPNMISIPAASKPQIGKVTTAPVLQQPQVSQGQVVIMPPANQTAPIGNLIQQPPMIVIVAPNPPAPNKQAPPRKILPKILPKIPASSDGSKSGTPSGSATASGTAGRSSGVKGNINEPRPLPPNYKQGQTAQTVQRMNMLNMARRTVADISRERLRYQDNEGDTYLHVAVCKTDSSMVQALLERLRREKLEIMIDVANKKRQTPLYLAVAANQPLMVNMLIRCNANPSSMAQVSSNDGKSVEVKAPIHVAASNGKGYLHTLQELVQSPDINLNIVNSEGHTALHCAILSHRQNKNGQCIDSTPIIEALIKAGAEPNSQDKKNGKTPLMYAVEKRDPALVERMLCMFDSGVKLRNIIQSQTFDGSTCIKIAEGLKSDFHPDEWQRLLNTLNTALNGDPPRSINGIPV